MKNVKMKLNKPTMKNEFFLLMVQHGGVRTEVCVLIRPAGTTKEEAAASFDGICQVVDIIELLPDGIVERESLAEFDELWSRLDKKDQVNLQFAIAHLVNRAAVYGTLRFEHALPPNEG